MVLHMNLTVMTTRLQLAIACSVVGILILHTGVYVCELLQSELAQHVMLDTVYQPSVTCDHRSRKEVIAMYVAILNPSLKISLATVSILALLCSQI